MNAAPRVTAVLMLIAGAAWTADTPGTLSLKKNDSAKGELGSSAGPVPGSDLAQAPRSAKPQPRSAPAVDPAVGDKSIRDAAAAYVKAYNAADAKTLAAMFTEQAKLVGPLGQVARGREEIEKLFASAFQRDPAVRMEVQVDSVEFLHPTVALEEGRATLTHTTTGFVENSGYSAIHVRDGDRWLISLASDWPQDPSAAEVQLGQLSWLVGDWVDESGSSAIATTFKRSADGKAILGESTVHIAGKPAMTITTRIGWNPATQLIHSWVFDSEGGVAEGDWTQEGDRWTAQMSGITGHGQVCSATNVYTWLSDHTFAFQSVNRVIGRKAVPDITWSVSARKPPAPSSAK